MFCQLYVWPCLMVLGSVNTNIINIPTSAESVNGMNKYVLYTGEQSWNTARRVCADMGGRLASLDTLILLQKIEAEETGAWSIEFNHMWTGLHRASDQSLVFDGDTCDSFNIAVSTMDVFKSTGDFDYDSSKQCFSFDKDAYRLARNDCKSKQNFICEVKADLCAYTGVESTPEVVSHPNANETDCQEECNQLSGCYLSGNVFPDHCVLLYLQQQPALMYQKMCYSAVVNETDTNPFIGSDADSSIPTSCPVYSVSEVPVSETSMYFGPSVSYSSILVSNILCPYSNIHTDTPSDIPCSAEVVTLTPSALSVTVTQISVETITQVSTFTQTDHHTITDILHSCSATNTPDAITVTGDCVTHTETLINRVISTVVLTTQLQCSSHHHESGITISPSCADSSVQIVPTTVTLYQKTSWTCSETHFVTSSSLTSSSIIGGPSLSSFLTSDLQMVTDEPPIEYQTTICKALNLSLLDPALLDEVVSSIVSELTLDTKNLSATIRKKKSAPDGRTSSQSIGMTAVILTCLPLGIILLVDFPGIVKDLRKTFKRVNKTGRP